MRRRKGIPRLSKTVTLILVRCFEPMKKITCSVVGARGYSGIETARLLLQHPNVRLTHCFATSDFELGSFFGSASLIEKANAVQCLPDSEILKNLTDVVFLATPAETSLSLAPQILAHGHSVEGQRPGTGVVVIDLSGAFRLKNNDYKKWYGFGHDNKELLAAAEYGLSPWAGPAGKGQLVANPGCYATAITMALAPLLKAGLIDENSVVVDAKSGTSGAGKKASENMLFTEVDGECLPYKVGKHQHYPEIVEALELLTGRKIDFHLTTSLLPTRRGIIAGVYAKVKEGVTLEKVESAFSESYHGYSLVRHGTVTKNPTLLSLKKVVGTGETHISYELEGGRLYVFSCIDNLLKGAASQAVENLNRIFDFPVSTGLTQLEALT